MNQYSQKLERIITNAYDILKEMSVASFAYKPNAQKWSKKEILGHLVDSAYNNHQRFLRAASQGNLIFGGYDQNEWVVKNNYQNRELSEILELWRFVNIHLSRMIASLSEELLEQQTTNHNFHLISMNTVPEGAPSSLGYLIEDYIFHVEHHLQQIIEEYKVVA